MEDNLPGLINSNSDKPLGVGFGEGFGDFFGRGIVC